MNKTIVQWIKCPSVRRENKYFYHAMIDGKKYTVHQPPWTDQWVIAINDNDATGFFVTAQAAMRAVLSPTT